MSMIILRNLLFFSFFVGVLTFKLKNHHDFRTSEALILRDCKKEYETIIIDDNSKQLDLSDLQRLHEEFRSVILYKDSLQGDCFNITKVDAILTITSSLTKPKKILDDIHSTTWWNVMTPVYVLNLLNNDCKIAINILQEMWKYDILASYYLCIENTQVQIYTFNPFTNRAPSNWNEVQRSSIDPHWTLYHQQYQPGICYGLDFDRTKYLDGYQITILISAATKKGFSLVGKYFNYHDLLPNETIVENRYHLTMDALAKTLNVSLRLYTINEEDVRKKYDSFIEATKNICKNVSANLMVHDYIMYFRRYSYNDSFTRTYALAWKTIGIATYHHGYQTLAEKVWDFYGTWTILFTIFVLLITFTVIWFTESKRTAFASFEIIRLLTSHSLYTRMNTLPLRIFFIVILIYFLIIQATFNGHLAKFLTKPELRKQPETKEDLRDLGYTKLHDSVSIREYLKKNYNKKETFRLRANVCLEHILYNDSSVACIFDRSLLLKYSLPHKKLYVSKKPFEMQYSRYPVYKYWPLLNRVNMVLISIDELGFRQLQSDDLIKNVTHNSIIAEAKSNDDFHPIKLENLMFSFLVLAIGLTSATLSFFVEMFINFKSKRKLIPFFENNRKRTLINVNRINVVHKIRK